ncbi:hypothetical protein ACIBEJ_16750 [Nonomuraea sp. NPDC050790]|uniref:hypothetical protein n=1 Tax=Nonomuraea sp. NPDC050790 TaxID=3364371 RepID=UPI003798AECC
MRRFIAVAAAAAAMMVASPAFAQVKPVDALKKQFVAGQGVRIKETSRTWVDKQDYIGAVREGVAAFGPKGVVAAEGERTPVLGPALKKQFEAEVKRDPKAADLVALLTERTYMVSSGKHYYIHGGLFSRALPDDKFWLRGDGDPTFAIMGDQLVNVLEPATLKHLLATGKHTGPRYRGSLTFAELHKLSPSFRAQMITKPSGKIGKSRISWRLTLDARQLPQRLAIDWTMPLTKKATIKGTTETRYSDWGAEISVTTPAAESVISIDDLVDHILKPPTPIDEDYVAVPPSDDGTVQ